MRQVTTAGLDVAKNLSRVRGAGAPGRPALERRLAREEVRASFADLPPCPVGPGGARPRTTGLASWRGSAARCGRCRRGA